MIYKYECLKQSSKPFHCWFFIDVFFRCMFHFSGCKHQSGSFEPLFRFIYTFFSLTEIQITFYHKYLLQIHEISFCGCTISSSVHLFLVVLSRIIMCFLLMLYVTESTLKIKISSDVDRLCTQEEKL